MFWQETSAKKGYGSKHLDLPHPIRPAGQKQQLVQDTCQPLEKPWNRQLLHGNNLHTSGKWGLVILIKPLDFSPRNMFSFKPPNDGLQVQGFKSKICMGY